MPWLHCGYAKYQTGCFYETRCSVKLRDNCALRSRSFKVTEAGTNRQYVCHFRLVINNNVGRSSTVYETLRQKV